MSFRPAAPDDIAKATCLPVCGLDHLTSGNTLSKLVPYTPARKVMGRKMVDTTASICAAAGGGAAGGLEGASLEAYSVLGAR
jgi:hypothetical protein